MMEKHNIIIVVTIVLGCIVMFQAIKSVVEIDYSEEILVTLEGMLSQEDDPDHDWANDPAGPKVLSLDVLDPEDNLNYKTYYLNSKNGEFYRFFPLSRRINDTVWSYLGPKPVIINGTVDHYVGVDQKVIRTIRILEIDFSDLGQWYKGVLGTKEVELGSFQFHNRSYRGLKGTILSLTLDTPLSGLQKKEVILASHEGYVYNVPYYGTGQPVADYSSGQSVMVRGLLTKLVDSKQHVLPVLMIFEVKPG